MMASAPFAALCLASGVFAAAAVADMIWRVPPGVLLLAGLAVYITSLWMMVLCVHAAVGRGIRSYLTGSEIEAALALQDPDPETGTEQTGGDSTSRPPLTLVPHQ